VIYAIAPDSLPQPPPDPRRLPLIIKPQMLFPKYKTS
jgi:hypothetical protein